MNGFDSVLGWVAIGAAASLAALMWPFLRGGAGIFIKLFLGPLGAVAVALLSRLVLPEETPAEQLLFAPVGAIACLCALQIGWHRYTRSKTKTVAA